MFTKLRLVLPITILIFSFSGSAQTSYWKRLNKAKTITRPSLEDLNLKKTQFFLLNHGDISGKLRTVTRSREAEKVLYFPDQQGNLLPYKVIETPVLAPELAKRYPSIKSFTGYGIGHEARIRFSISHKGFQGMVVRADAKKTLFIDQSTEGGEVYIAYTREARTGTESKLVCNTPGDLKKGVTASSARLVDDQVLRKFRIAVSATGEYTQFHGGTVADALAAINATLTRVNEVFERDLGVTLELIGNTDQVIYTNPQTDPYNGNLSVQVQSTLNTEIGPANYDVGHLFHEDNNNGNAGFIGAVCKDNQKGSAFAATTAPQGDIFDLDFVAHELGHQFGANHTWSFESEGTLVQAEPASGTTIMGYAGIASGNNVAPNGDDYFHYFSIQQITDYLQTVSCAEEIPLTNAPPVISPTGNFVIPRSTAFVLTANATDPDPGDVLTYAWEQIDDGIVTTETFGPDRPNGANFRSLPPTTSAERYFPRLSEVVQGNLTQTNPPINSAWETVSDVERDMNFALTVRDNAAGGGQVASDIVNVSVQSNAGPFIVSSQNTSETYAAGSAQTVLWEVANTNLAPINAQLVDLFLSTDGGMSFPILLVQGVPNDGEQEVQIPSTPTNEARIMVKASNNIFFAINATDFSILESEVVLDFSDLSYEVCQPDDLVIPFVLETSASFAEEVTFSLSGAPAGLNADFSPLSASADGTAVDLTLSSTASVAPGNYMLTVRGDWPGGFEAVDLQVLVNNTSFTDVVLNSPSDSEINVSLRPSLEWQPDPQATSYDLEVATDPAFSALVVSANVLGTSYLVSDLAESTVFYWRVKPRNGCGEGSFSTPFSFQTIAVNCKTITANGLPREISSVGTPTITSFVTFANNLAVEDVRVTLDIEHSFLADLTVSLTSPAGTTVTLVANSCGDLQDIDAIFEDSASGFNCQGNPGISGTVSPLGSLASFRGESTLGDWILTVEDSAPADGGFLNDFTLEICAEGSFRPDDDGDGVFDDGDDLCLGTPPGTEVGLDGCPVFRFPPDNFSVAIESETCIANDNGSIAIAAMQSMDYSVTVSGNGIDLSDSFTTNYQLNNLQSGVYSFCVTGTDGTDTFEPFCFEAVISEPQPLGVSAQLNPDGTEMQLSLSGSDLFFIELNGIETQTTLSEITLDLKEGVNTLKVHTALACQGVYEATFLASGRPVLYPNPFVDRVTAFLGPLEGGVTVEVFDAHGRFIKKLLYAQPVNEIEMDLAELATGMYFVRLRAQGIRETYKLLKR